MNPFRPSYRAVIIAIALFATLLFTVCAGAPAQAQGVNLAQLVAEVQSLQSTVNSQASTISTLQGQVGGLQTTVNNEQQMIDSQQQTIFSQQQTINSLQTKVDGQATTIQDQESQIEGDEALISAQAAILQTVQNVTAPLSLTGTPGTYPATLTITGVNVQIVNGLGATNGKPTDPFNLNTNPVAVNGLGNLIIGYNASQVPVEGVDIRSGSHNLILGDGNNYSSYGGIVGGSFNVISNGYASVMGGEYNDSSGELSLVGGGQYNLASGTASVVTGGQDNIASSKDSLKP